MLVSCPLAYFPEFLRARNGYECGCGTDTERMSKRTAVTSGRSV